MGQQLLGTDVILRMNDFNLLGLVQSEDWAPNFQATDIMEMGNTGRVDTAMELETSGSIELGSIGGMPGLIARMVVQRDVSGAFTGYLYNPAGGNGKNGYTITQDTLKECVFDLLMHEKTDQVTFDRSLALPRCFPTTFSGKADVNGVASETVNWQGDFVVGYPKPYHDLRAVPCTIGTGANAGKLVLADNTITSTTHTLSYVWIDETRLSTLNTDPAYVALDASGGTITVTGLTLPGIYTKAVGRALVSAKTPSTTFPTISARDTTVFAIKGYQADIYLAPAVPGTPTDSEHWLRAQSIDWSIDLKVQTLKQIKYNSQGSTVYCRVPTYPFDISVSVSVYETDWADWKAVLTKTFPGNNILQDTYDLAPVNLKSSFSVVLVYKTKAGTELCRWNFSDLRVDGYGNRNNVGGRSEISWSLKGTQFTLTGQNA